MAELEEFRETFSHWELLPAMQVGKFGITANVEISLSDALEKNELIKVRAPPL